MTIETQTPCLLTCIKELNEPRYMSLSGIMDCYAKPVAVYDYNTLKDDPLIDPDHHWSEGFSHQHLQVFHSPAEGSGQDARGR